MSIDVSVKTLEDEAVLLLSGRIDREAATELESAWISARATAPSTVLLDFSRIDYINSTGIALIVGFITQARASGVSLRAAGLTEHYRHIFDITRLSDYIEIA